MRNVDGTTTQMMMTLLLLLLIVMMMIMMMMMMIMPLPPPGMSSNESCLREVVEGTEELCGRFTDYSLKYVSFLHGACSRGVDASDVLDVVKRVCA
jgi:hypothetical protein